ncbi:hypothetical protein B0H10DRAFT_2067076 [Mycena sp. CBHHK59/15]|nr:hypothetical protein B0H10DRAFT_2067076 [Mycena sp. CBHHK59/15]
MDAVRSKRAAERMQRDAERQRRLLAEQPPRMQARVIMQRRRNLVLIAQSSAAVYNRSEIQLYSYLPVISQSMSY